MKRGPFLLDTGFLVALINAADPAHQRCAELWGGLAGPFLTTEGVLVETAHLVRKNRSAFPTIWALVKSVGTLVAPLTRPRVDRARELMARYEDVPMDYVDATLVALAEETQVLSVLSLDGRGFDTYRTREGKKFKRLPIAP